MRPPVNVTYVCPVCNETVRADLRAEPCQLRCSHCGSSIEVAREVVERNRIERCLVCPSTDLFQRKDFPQRLGVTLVGIGIVGSSIAWYYGDLLWTFGILFASALADVLLYAVVGECLMCYRCHAQYRNCNEMDAHGPFDLETHEKYRQLAARLQDTRSRERSGMA